MKKKEYCQRLEKQLRRKLKKDRKNMENTKEARDYQSLGR